MPAVRDLMTRPAQCVDSKQTLSDAARLMADLDVGALPICGEDGKLAGMLTDRDIVVKALADGRDPGMTSAGELANGRPFYVDANADAADALAVMAEHQVRRLPVIEDHQIVGMVSQCDLSRAMPREATAELASRLAQP